MLREEEVAGYPSRELRAMTRSTSGLLRGTMSGGYTDTSKLLHLGANLHSFPEQKGSVFCKLMTDTHEYWGGRGRGRGMCRVGSQAAGPHSHNVCRPVG